MGGGGGLGVDNVCLESVGSFELMTLSSAGGVDGISVGSGARSNSTTCGTIWVPSGKAVNGRGAGCG